MAEPTKTTKSEPKQNAVNIYSQDAASPQGISFMNTPVMQKKKAELDKLIHNSIIQKNSKSNSGSFKFIDNRPEAIAQRKLQTIINNSSPRIIQKEKDEKEKTLQGKFEIIQEKTDLKDDEQKLIQGKFETVQKKEKDEEDKIIQKKSNETGLPDNLKSGVENLSGISMDNVKVHYNSDKPAQLNALAYTQGTEIHVAPNQEKHVPHEAWHVVQQAQGRVPVTMQLKGVAINDNPGLEQEADRMGAMASSLQVPQLKNANDTIQKKLSNRTENMTQRQPVVQMSCEYLEGEVGLLADGMNSDQALQDAQDQINAAILAALLALFRRRDHHRKRDPDDDGSDDDDDDSGYHKKRVKRTPVSGSDISEKMETGSFSSSSLMTGIGSAIQTFSLSNQFSSNAIKDNGKIIQKSAVIAGLANVNPGAAFGAVAAAPAAAAVIAYIAHAAKNTSGGVTTTSLHKQPKGTGVGATRPTDWVKFVSIIGGKKNNKYVQGHSLSQKLGGLGKNNNLSPFTRSLNGLHSNRVEQPIINFQKVADQYADYNVTANYGGNPTISGIAQGHFMGLTIAKQTAGMVAAGVITAAQAAKYVIAGAIPAKKITAAKTYIDNYVNAAFPQDIDCKVYFIKKVGGGGYKKTAQQQVQMSND
jgi:hypothetical protein